MNEILFMYMIMIPSIMLGFIIRHKLHDIKVLLYRGYTRLVFIDTGDVIEHYGRSQTKTTKKFGIEREFTIDESKKKRDTLFLNSKMAEPPTIEADINKFKYWIDSNVFHSVYKNKILETMMLIQENSFIRMILILCIVSLFVSVGSIYMSYTILQDVSSMQIVITEMSNKLIVK